ncbi:MAG: hypothetical protein PHQ81_10365 [Methanofollis sp.]|nr:hypothetical protein [Methanofollis sp.]
MHRLRNMEVRNSLRHLLLSSESGKAREFWDDLTDITLAAGCAREQITAIGVRMGLKYFFLIAIDANADRKEELGLR